MIIIFILLICLIGGFVVWSGIKVGADSDFDNFYNRGEKITSKCEKCNKTFDWFEGDALIKYEYGKKYILYCPYCHKLIKVTKHSH